MVKYSEDLDLVFFALSNSMRRSILEVVSIGPVASSELAVRIGLSLPALHKHTKVLLAAKLIKKYKDGRVAYIEYFPPSIRLAEDWLESQKQYYSDVLDAEAKNNLYID